LFNEIIFPFIQSPKTSSIQSLHTTIRTVSRDIDIQLNTDAIEAVSFAKNLESRLKSSGENVRIATDKPTLIESRGLDGEWHHAVDIHFKGEVVDDVMSPTVEGSYGFKFGQKPISIEQVDVMPLSEQGLRKGASSLSWQEKSINPASHRMKDIPDFFAAQDTLISSMESNPVSKIFNFREIQKGKSLLNEWKSLNPDMDTNVNVKIPLLSKKSPPTSPGNINSNFRSMAIISTPGKIQSPKYNFSTNKKSSSPSISLTDISPGSTPGYNPKYNFKSRPTRSPTIKIPKDSSPTTHTPQKYNIKSKPLSLTKTSISLPKITPEKKSRGINYNKISVSPPYKPIDNYDPPYNPKTDFGFERKVKNQRKKTIIPDDFGFGRKTHPISDPGVIFGNVKKKGGFKWSL